MKWPFPICSRVHSSEAIVFGREVYGDDTNWFIDTCHTVFLNISNIKYWLYYRLWPKHKHHVVYTDLEPGYQCEDTRILWACMKCLERYIAEQDGVEELKRWSEELLATEDDGNGTKVVSDQQAHKQLEALTIYQWWKVEKPKDEARREFLMHEVYGDKDFMTLVPCEDDPKMSRAVFKELSPEKEAMRKEMRELDIKIDEDEQSMLHRLINIRHGLWT